MEKIYTTKSTKQTQNLGLLLAKKILKTNPQKGAVVLGLKGNLGGGKTTFLQGLAKGLGVKEKILSPTFVVLKRFSAQGANAQGRPASGAGPASGWKFFYHIDCYRLKNEKDILELGFKKIIADSKNIVAIEWPERIKKVLPKETIFINFKFIDENKREIII